MKNILMSVLVVTGCFLFFALVMLPLLFIFFIPILPIMLLAFPMMVMNEGADKVHWTQKPYLWYFKNVWLKSMCAIRLFNT
jgi:hypothetical protein